MHVGAGQWSIRAVTRRRWQARAAAMARQRSAMTICEIAIDRFRGACGANRAVLRGESRCAGWVAPGRGFWRVFGLARVLATKARGAGCGGDEISRDREGYEPVPLVRHRG